MHHYSLADKEEQSIDTLQLINILKAAAQAELNTLLDCTHVPYATVLDFIASLSSSVLVQSLNFCMPCDVYQSYLSPSPFNVH